MGKYFKVIQTTDLGVFEREFRIYIPTKVGINQENDSYQAVAAVAWGVFKAFSMEKVGDAPVTPYDVIVGGSNVQYLIECGMDAIAYTQLYVGERYYFADGAFVRVGALSVNQYGILSITYQYHKNNALVGTLTVGNISANPTGINGSNGYPIVPYACEVDLIWNNTTQSYPNRVLQYGTEYNAYRNGYRVSYSSYGAAPDWLVTYFDDFTPVDMDNPYEGAGTSDTGGGDPANQNFGEESDDVSEDAMPTLSAVGTGFATLFTPSKSQLKNLADIMWGAQWWQALQNEVMGIDKMFVSLGIMPFVVTQGSTVEVTWLGMSLTEVYLTLAAQQYFEFDMGTIDLSNDARIWTSDSAMDYSPFCRLGIYLPFIGFQDIDIDECRGKVLGLKYRIDALSGSCVALIKVGNSTLYQFTGNCMVQIPITSQSFDEFISTVTNVAIAGTNVKTAQALAGGGDNVAAEAYTREKNPISEVQGKYQVMQHAAMVSHAENGLASATANAISGLKPSYNKSGAVSASNSLMAVKQPYLFLSSPNVCVPEHYQRYGGFPSNITDTLGNFEGFTVVNSIRLNGLVATAPEVEEIYELLHSGVII